MPKQKTKNKNPESDQVSFSTCLFIGQMEGRRTNMSNTTVRIKTVSPECG